MHAASAFASADRCRRCPSARHRPPGCCTSAIARRSHSATPTVTCSDRSPLRGQLRACRCSPRTTRDRFAPVLDLVRDGDRAFLLGVDTTALDRPFVLAEVDLATLDLVALRRFSVDRPARSLNGARLLATQRGDVYAYFAVPLVDTGVPMRSELVG